MDDLDRFREAGLELTAILALAAGEIDSYNQLALKEPESEFLGRMKVRVLFACIEAHVFHLKSSALAFGAAENTQFTSEELEFLKEEKSGPNGLSKRKISLKENLKPSFALFARSTGHEFTLDLSDEGYAQFRKAMDIRDRITHPKRVSDWAITTQDSDLIDAAWNWFGTNLADLGKRINEPL